MASIPIMLSDFLAENAQTAATGNRMSLSSQIEHWAWIGKAAESFLSPSTVMALKRCDGNLSALEDSEERGQVIRELSKMRVVLTGC